MSEDENIIVDDSSDDMAETVPLHSIPERYGSCVAEKNADAAKKSATQAR